MAGINFTSDTIDPLQHLQIESNNCQMVLYRRAMIVYGTWRWTGIFWAIRHSQGCGNTPQQNNYPKELIGNWLRSEQFYLNRLVWWPGVEKQGTSIWSTSITGCVPGSGRLTFYNVDWQEDVIEIHVVLWFREVCLRWTLRKQLHFTGRPSIMLWYSDHNAHISWRYWKSSKQNYQYTLHSTNCCSLSWK